MHKLNHCAHALVHAFHKSRCTCQRDVAPHGIALLKLILCRCVNKTLSALSQRGHETLNASVHNGVQGVDTREQKGTEEAPAEPARWRTAGHS